MNGAIANKSWRKQYGKLFVVRIFYKKHDLKHTAWAECICECGTKCKVRVYSLRCGNTASCGCSYKLSNLKHGETNKTVEYKVWKNIKDRCYNKNRTDFEYYGGRGIKVYKPWLSKKHGFIRFIKWVLSDIGIGRKPDNTYSIDRYPDNDGDYVPGNLRWAGKKQQASNRRNNSKKCN